MFAVTATKIDADNPLNGLTAGERPDPDVPDGWTTVTVKAAALNHHDLWSLKGVGLPADRLPMILGCDAAGVDEDGNEVIVHSVIGDPGRGGGDETLDPKRSLLSETYPGTLAEKVAVPRRNLVPKPAGLSFEEAACLPTAWLTAYRMLFDKAGLQPGASVLVQGAGGGVATAAIALASAAGYRVYATSRSEAKRERARELGADEAVDYREPGWAGKVGPVDVVFDGVGGDVAREAFTLLRSGGRMVSFGLASGEWASIPEEDAAGRGVTLVRPQATPEQLREFTVSALQEAAQGRLRPVIGRRFPLEGAADAHRAIESRSTVGKTLLEVRPG
ncbi:quinone oxidoreductase family protein [Actinomadura geliboluensis]|uniref:Zinc-binding dehydrogenase n=1 Tax=Actinomadura geliboluensis TaxID=882440 RepID=A0A5S4GML5_9ACTN|nr:zinc-binding dehydrogenase [Actinomadura geliboluensis]TMR34123.1 zinc-binding dehydrogenase [Actinomadura geliboluensis]